MYNVDWIVENRLLLIRGVGDQTRESIALAVEQLTAKFETAKAPVHIIIDNRYTGRYPNDIGGTKRLLSKHEKTGHFVLVGGDLIAKFVVSMLIQLTGIKKPHVCDTIDDGVKWLRSIDATLPEAISFEESPELINE